jgi:hypothetical protein
LGGFAGMASAIPSIGAEYPEFETYLIPKLTFEILKAKGPLLFCALAVRNLTYMQVT